MAKRKISTQKELKVKLGAKVTKLREATGLSMVDLANMIGMRKQALWRLENGDANATLETISKLCVALDCKIEDFFKGFKF